MQKRQPHYEATKVLTSPPRLGKEGIRVAKW